MRQSRRLFKTAIEFWDDGGKASRQTKGGFASDEAAIDDLESLARSMTDTAQRVGGKWARGHHKYKNRTRNLERSTDAFLTKDTAGEICIDLEARAEYAIYVAKRGKLDITPAGERTEAAIDRLIDKLDE